MNLNADLQWKKQHLILMHYCRSVFFHLTYNRLASNIGLRTDHAGDLYCDLSPKFILPSNSFHTRPSCGPLVRPTKSHTTERCCRLNTVCTYN